MYIHKDECVLERPDRRGGTAYVTSSVKSEFEHKEEELYRTNGRRCSLIVRQYRPHQDNMGKGE